MQAGVSTPLELKSHVAIYIGYVPLFQMSHYWKANGLLVLKGLMNQVVNHYITIVIQRTSVTSEERRYLLAIVGRERQQRRDVEHNLTVLVMSVHRVQSRRVSWNTHNTLPLVISSTHYRYSNWRYQNRDSDLLYRFMCYSELHWEEAWLVYLSRNNNTGHKISTLLQ